MIRKKIVISLLLTSTYFIAAEKALEDTSSKEIIVTQKETVAAKKSSSTQLKHTQSTTSSGKKKKDTSKKDAAVVVKTPLKNESKDITSSSEITKETGKSPIVVCNKIAYRIPSKALEKSKDIIITKGMLTTKSLEGKSKTPEEIIFDYIAYDKAVNEYHMPPSTKEAEQHIENLKNQYGLSHKDIEKLFRESGLTYEEGLEQLVMFYTIRSFLSGWITSKVVVTEEEIKHYYDAHPEVVPTSYKIEKSFISKDSITEQAVTSLNKYGVGQDNIVWQPAYWIAEEDLVESKKFITKMHEGVVRVIDAQNEWEVIRLVKKIEGHVKPLSQRYREIVEKLQYEKFEEKLQQFKKEILSEYDVIAL